jgi:hypothetical protein
MEFDFSLPREPASGIHDRRIGRLAYVRPCWADYLLSYSGEGFNAKSHATEVAHWMEPGYLRSPPPKKSKECKSPREQGAGGKKSLVVRVLAWLSDLRAILYSVLSHGRGLKPRLAQKACFEEASSNAQPGEHQSHQGTIQREAITNMHYGLQSRFSTYLRLHYRVTIQELGNAKIGSETFSSARGARSEISVPNDKP